MARDTSIGGFASITVGPGGSGKTSFCLHECQMFLHKYPNELIFWKDSPGSISQFDRLGDGVANVLIHKKCKINFRDLLTGKPVDLHYKTFKTLSDIVDVDTGLGLVERGRLNVVYFPMGQDYMWIDLMEHLRHVPGWKSLFIDEIEDIAAANPSKRDFESQNFRMEANLKFSNNLKQFRKALINIEGNTQNFKEIDWRVLGKLNSIVYLRGSRVSDESLVAQHVVNALPIGQAYIDWENRMFGKIAFKSFPPRDRLIEARLI